MVRDLERMLELVGELPEMSAGESGGGSALPGDAVQGDVQGEPPGEVGEGKDARLPRDQVLANAPAVGGDLLLVPMVLGPANDPEER